MLLLQLSFSQIYHVFAVPSEMMEVLDTTTKYISTNKKRQNSLYATKRFIFLYHSEGTWIIVSCTVELLINNHVPVHSLHSMVAKMVHLQVLIENVLVTTKLRTSTAQSTIICNCI